MGGRRRETRPRVRSLEIGRPCEPQGRGDDTRVETALSGEPEQPRDRARMRSHDVLPDQLAGLDRVESSGGPLERMRSTGDRLRPERPRAALEGGRGRAKGVAKPLCERERVAYPGLALGIDAADDAPDRVEDGNDIRGLGAVEPRPEAGMVSAAMARERLRQREGGKTEGPDIDHWLFLPHCSGV